MDPFDPEKLIQLVITAVQAGNWSHAVILGVIAAVYVIRTFLAPQVPALNKFVSSDAGGAILVIVAGAATEVARVLGGGASLSWPVIGAGLALAFKAAGGYAMLKKLAVPVSKDVWSWSKAAWAWGKSKAKKSHLKEVKK